MSGDGVGRLGAPQVIYRGYRYAWAIETAPAATGPANDLSAYQAALFELKDWETGAVLQAWSVASGHVEISDVFALTVEAEETRDLVDGTYGLAFSTGTEAGAAVDLRAVGVFEVKTNA